MNMERVTASIERAEADLKARGQWTRRRWLPFTSDWLPIARIDYGAVLSNGTLEARIGTVTIYRDGHAVTSAHL